jgi:glycosyltransferase involved in cell wall biosynthesis
MMNAPKRRAMTQPRRTTSLSVVIPAFNEVKAITGVVERVLSLQAPLADVGITGPEVIVVDDGSRDGTAEAVWQLEGVRVMRHAQNRGYGAALKTGLASAQGDLVAFLDADGTYPPEHLPELCAALLSGADVVIGSRMARGESEMPLVRRLGNRIFAALVSLLSSRRVFDCASGMRVLRREVLPQLYPLPDGLNFTPIMSLRAVHEGLAVIEVPITYRERIGRSKLSVVRDGLQYAHSIVWTALSYNPARVLGVLGITGVVIAAFVGSGLVIARARGITTLGPSGVAAVFAALVAGVAGVSLFNLGITFNYLIALFRRQPVRAGVFGKPLFAAPLDRHFGWLGLATAGTGVSIAGAALGLGLRGWEVARLWLYLVGSALLILVGLQLVISWVLMRTLEDLSQRDVRTQTDMRGGNDRV